MRVLVTRPSGEAEEIAYSLAASGHQAIIAPLLEICFRDGGEIPLDDVQAILVTSANGIRALARRTPRRDIPVFAVGDHSADAARREGFSTVEDAKGDAAALAELAIARLRPERGVLIHACGAEAGVGLAGRLREGGYSVRTEILYEAIAAEALPVAAGAALENNALDAVLFYSPRTAEIFATLVRREGFVSPCRAVRALCISSAAADRLAGLGFRQVEVAPTPSREAVLALLR